MDEPAFHRVLAGERVTVVDGLDVHLDALGDGFVIYQGDQRVALNAVEFAHLFRVFVGVMDAGAAYDDDGPVAR